MIMLKINKLLKRRVEIKNYYILSLLLILPSSALLQTTYKVWPTRYANKPGESVQKTPFTITYALKN